MGARRETHVQDAQHKEEARDLRGGHTHTHTRGGLHSIWRRGAYTAGRQQLQRSRILSKNDKAQTLRRRGSARASSTRRVSTAISSLCAWICTHNSRREGGSVKGTGPATFCLALRLVTRAWRRAAVAPRRHYSHGSSCTTADPLRHRRAKTTAAWGAAALPDDSDSRRLEDARLSVCAWERPSYRTVVGVDASDALDDHGCCVGVACSFL